MKTHSSQASNARNDDLRIICAVHRNNQVKYGKNNYQKKSFHKNTRKYFSKSEFEFTFLFCFLFVNLIVSKTRPENKDTGSVF